MEMPIGLILMQHTEDLEVLEDFAARNEMEVVSVEVSGSFGLGYFEENDILDCLSLLVTTDDRACPSYKLTL